MRAAAAKTRIGTFTLDRSNLAGPFMSDFSSWGATPDLRLKPEITAHGGEITSTVPGGYDEQSGTSMATPNMAGFMADNLANGTLRQWHLEELQALLARTDITLLDTRTRREFAMGHINGFLNIPVDELRERLDEVPTGKPVYVICQSGLRSYIATRILAGYGYTAYNFSGGYRFYAAVMEDRALVARSTACGKDG